MNKKNKSKKIGTIREGPFSDRITPLSRHQVLALHVENINSYFFDTIINSIQQYNDELNSVIENDFYSIIPNNDWSIINDEWVMNWSNGVNLKLVRKYSKSIKIIFDFYKYIANPSQEKIFKLAPKNEILEARLEEYRSVLLEFEKNIHLLQYISFSANEAKIIHAVNSTNKIININLHSFDQADIDVKTWAIGTNKEDIMYKLGYIFNLGIHARRSYIKKSKNIDLPKIFNKIIDHHIRNNLDTIYIGNYHGSDTDLFYEWSYMCSTLKQDDMAFQDLVENPEFTIYPEFEDLNCSLTFRELIVFSRNILIAGDDTGFVEFFLSRNSYYYKSPIDDSFGELFSTKKSELHSSSESVDLDNQVPYKLKKIFFDDIKNINKSTMNELTKFKQKHPEFPILISFPYSPIENFVNDKKNQFSMNVKGLVKLFDNKSLKKKNTIIVIENSIFKLPPKINFDTLARKTLIFNYNHDSKSDIEQVFGKSIIDFSETEIPAVYKYFLPILEYMFMVKDSYKSHRGIIKEFVRDKLELDPDQFDTGKYNQALNLLSKHTGLIEIKKYGYKLTFKGKETINNFINDPNSNPILVSHSNGRTTYLIYLDGYFSINRETIRNLKSLELKTLKNDKKLKLKSLVEDMNLNHKNFITRLEINKSLESNNFLK